MWWDNFTINEYKETNVYGNGKQVCYIFVFYRLHWLSLIYYLFFMDFIGYLQFVTTD